MFTDSELLGAEADLALHDAYYLSTRVLKVGEDEHPRQESELKPIYTFFDRPRPQHLSRLDRWFRFWSSPRFTAKSYIVLVYILARIIRNPNITVMYQSQEKGMAAEGVRLVREWLEMDEITRLYGGFKSNDWGKEDFIVAQRSRRQKDPTLRAVGLDNPLQGKRVDLSVFDDMVGETNNTEEGLRKVEFRYDAALPLVKPGGEIIWECTRWNPFDMSSSGNTMSDRPGILRQWELSRQAGAPAIWDCAPPRGFFGAYAVDGDEKFFPHAVPGEPLFPSVLPESTIQEYRDQMSPAVFASQIMNDPITDDMRKFDQADFQYFRARDENGKLNPDLMGAVPFMGVDPNSARITKTAGDDTTFVVIFVKWSGKTFDVFVVAWTGGRWRTQRVQDTFLNLYETWKPRMIYPEVNTGGEWFIGPIRQKAQEKGLYLPIHEVTASLHGTGKKPQRIGAVESLYQQHRVWHDVSLKNSKGEMQLLQYTGDGKGHDDFADVLAHAILEGTKKKWGVRSDREPRRRLSRERRYAGL